MKLAHPKNLKVAEMLENRILPKVQHAHRHALQTWPYESDTASEEMLEAAVAFLRGRTSHLSGFITSSTYRWQGVEFVIWIKDIIETHSEGYPAVTAKEALEWLTPFLTALLHHQDLPQEID